MACEILQVDDVRSPLAGGGQWRDAERVHGDVGIKLEGRDVAGNELLDRPGRHRFGPEAILP